MNKLLRFIAGSGIIFLFMSGNAFVCSVNAEEEVRRDTGAIDAFIHIMDSPYRLKWQKPFEVIDSLDIREGETVADIGAGSGYFTVILAKKVGDKGEVYAVDIERRMLEYIADKANKEGLDNIKYVLASAEDPLLPIASIDLIFLCNTYTYIEKRDVYLKRLYGVLKKNGRLAVVDFLPGNSPVGPPPDQRLTKEKVMEEVLKAGFRLGVEYSFLPYQYYVVFKK